MGFEIVAFVNFGIVRELDIYPNSAVITANIIFREP
jgi:hypothetical protein